MKLHPTAAWLAAGLFLIACSDAPSAPDPLLHEREGGERVADRITVMTQNLYVGADVDAVLLALMSPDPSDDVAALLTAIETVRKTDFAARAEAIADAIARERPHVVGVQEVSDIFIDLTALGLPLLNQSFWPILLDALADRGLNYTVADSMLNFIAAPVPGVSLTDYDAILVDASRVTVDFTYRQHFSANLGPVAPGVELQRGLVEVAATIEGRRYYFVNTHLEPDIAGIDLSGLRAAQAWEMAVAVLGDSAPAFIMGDLNDTPGSAMYEVLQGAGFRDVWTELRPGVDGFTTPRPPDLANRRDALTRRIDYIWARGLEHRGGRLQGRIELLGDRPWERVQGPVSKLWPSDHLGLVAALRFRR